MQIRKPVVPKKIFFNAFAIFLVKLVYHKLYIFHFQIYDTNWPSLVYTVQQAKNLKSLIKNSVYKFF